MVKIELTQGYSVTIDDEDYDKISTYRWKVLKSHGHIYAARTDSATGSTILMHRILIGALPTELVDHKDRDGLNNRKDNLRKCTTTQNLANMGKTRGSSQYKGVYWNKEKGKWQAQISSGGGVVEALGRFVTEEAAARAYDRRARQLHGEFARCNFDE